MSNERHEAVGGRVHLYRRQNSRFWQCQGSFGGKSERVSTKTENLDEARHFAENWYLSKEQERTGVLDSLPANTFGVASTQGAAYQLPLHDKKARLLAAAIELVSEIGFHETQVTAIAERAGLAPGTLYRHYKSRTALLVKVVAHVSQHEVNVAAGITMGSSPPPEMLRNCAWTFGSRAIRGKRLGYALVAEPVESEIEIERLRYRQKLMRVFGTIIERGIRSGDFSVQSVDVSSACIVGSLFEALVGPLVRDVNLSNRQRLRHVDEIAAFCVRAVGGQ